MRSADHRRQNSVQYRIRLGAARPRPLRNLGSFFYLSFLIPFGFFRHFIFEGTSHSLEPPEWKYDFSDNLV